MKRGTISGGWLSFFLAFLLTVVLGKAGGLMAAAPSPPVETPGRDSPVPEKTQPVLDLVGVYHLAREKDPAFQSEKYRHEASGESLVQARSEWMPTVEADAYYQETRQKIYKTDVTVYEKENVNYSSRGYTLTLTQPIFAYPLFMQVKQAKAEVRQADLRFEAARQDLILRVAEAYIGVLDAWENLAFLRSEEEALDRHFQLARTRFDSGLAPLTDFHDAKARLAYTVAMRVRTEKLLDDALEALTEITGRKIGKVANLKYNRAGTDTGDPAAPADESQAGETPAGKVMPLLEPDPNRVDAWVEAALKQNLEIRIQRQTLEIARQEIDRLKGRHWPTLELVGRINRDVQGGSLFGGGSDMEAREALLQANVPLYRGGYVSSKVRQARKIYLAARADLEREIRRARRQAKAAFFGVKSAIEKAGALRQSVVSSRIALEAKREGYRSGLFPSLVVIDAERDALQAKREYLRAQYEYILNGLRLKRAAGILSESDLAGINRWLE